MKTEHIIIDGENKEAIDAVLKNLGIYYGTRAVLLVPGGNNTIMATPTRNKVYSKLDERHKK